jgi:MoxR-like ATPase
MISTLEETKEQIEQFRAAYAALRQEIGKVIVGHDAIVEGTLIALFAGGHVLLEGVPGLGKTLLVRTLGEVLDLSFSRIQFTPDLMPADILGTNLVMELPDGRRAFEFQAGPIFAHLILADEINRATPKTQSATLEAMQEHSVTAGGQIRRLAEPFFVLATQNPIDQEGTYPLPEAQLDRFFFKLLVEYPSAGELIEVLNRTTETVKPQAQRVLTRDQLIDMQALIRRVQVQPAVLQYAVDIVQATHPKPAAAGEAKDPATRHLRYGSSPRGAQALILAAKVRALADTVDPRNHVSFEDVFAVARPALRHRLILNFEAEAGGMTTDLVLAEILPQFDRSSRAAA